MKFLIIFSTLFTFIVANVALAAPGSLDPSFGSGGKVFGPRGEAHGVAIQRDSKIVVAGSAAVNGHSNVAVARYKRNGTLDTTFGTDGKVTTAIGDESNGYAVAVQPDGKIVVAGNAWSDCGPSCSNPYNLAVVRYNTNGSLDLDFGDSGKVVTFLGRFGSIGLGVAIQRDNKILVAGSAEAGLVTLQDVALVRYNSNGSLDVDFGDGGSTLTDVYGNYEDGNAIALQSDGKIIVAGTAETPSAWTDFLTVRYNADGTLDPSFGTGGKVVTSIGPDYDYGRAVAIQSDGKIIVAGGSFMSATQADFSAVRYLHDGSLDRKFGKKGKIVTDLTGEDDQGYAVVLGPNRTIVIAGYCQTGNAQCLAIYRDGDLKKTVRTDLTPYTEWTYGAAVQRDGKIVVIGASDVDMTGYQFSVTRYLTE